METKNKIIEEYKKLDRLKRIIFASFGAPTVHLDHPVVKQN